MTFREYLMCKTAADPATEKKEQTPAAPAKAPEKTPATPEKKEPAPAPAPKQETEQAPKQAPAKPANKTTWRDLLNGLGLSSGSSSAVSSSSAIAPLLSSSSSASALNNYIQDRRAQAARRKDLGVAPKDAVQWETDAHYAKPGTYLDKVFGGFHVPAAYSTANTLDEGAVKATEDRLHRSLAPETKQSLIQFMNRLRQEYVKDPDAARRIQSMIRNQATGDNGYEKVEIPGMTAKELEDAADVLALNDTQANNKYASAQAGARFVRIVNSALSKF